MPSSRAADVRDTADELLQRAVLVELAAVVALLVGFRAYTIAVDAALDPYFLDSDTALLLLRSVLVLAGAAALTVAYAAWRGDSLSVSVPDGTDARVVVAAAVAGGALATLPFLDLALRTGVGGDHLAATLADLGSVFTTRSLIRIALFVPATALFAHGLLQGALRRAFDGSRLTVAVTTLLGGYLAAPTVPTYGTFGNGPWLSLWGSRAVVAVLLVLAIGVAVAGRDEGSAGALAALPALIAIAAVAALAVEVGYRGVFLSLIRAAVIGVAASAYDASGSLAAPALVYAAFAAVSSVLYVTTLVATFGG